MNSPKYPKYPISEHVFVLVNMVGEGTPLARFARFLLQQGWTPADIRERIRVLPLTEAEQEQINNAVRSIMRAPAHCTIGLDDNAHDLLQRLSQWRSENI